MCCGDNGFFQIFSFDPLIKILISTLDPWNLIFVSISPSATHTEIFRGVIGFSIFFPHNVCCRVLRLRKICIPQFQTKTNTKLTQINTNVEKLAHPKKHLKIRYLKTPYDPKKCVFEEISISSTRSHHLEIPENIFSEIFFTKQKTFFT